MVYYMQWWGRGAVGGVRKYVVIIPRVESFVPENRSKSVIYAEVRKSSSKIKMGLDPGGEGPVH